MWADFDAIGDFDEDRTPKFNAEDTSNWYVILNQNAKKPKALAACPGLLLEDTVPSSFAFRALFSFNGYLYGVVGEFLYKWDNALNRTTLGELSTTTGFVSISANIAGQLMLVDGQYGYIYNTVSTAFSKITDPNFPAVPSMVTYLDGYFIVSVGNSTLFYISAPNDGTTWDSLAFADAFAYPGNLVGLAVVNRRLFLFKSDSIEVWYNAGASDFPFRRDNDLIFNYGCAAASSIYSENGYLFWLSQDRNGVSSVMMSNGDAPTVVSSQAIDSKIRTFTNPADVNAYVYKDDGHIFYVLNWTTDDETYVYDATTNLWHRMQTIPHKPIDGQPNASKTRHWANCHAYFSNQHFVGSYKDSKLYAMSLDYSDNAGEPIPRIRVFKHLSQPNYRAIQVDALQLDFQTGIGNVSGIYRFPQAYLSTSKDGGITFGNEIRAHLGAIGLRRTRCIWRQLGIQYDFVFKVTIYADVQPIYLLGGAIDMKGLKR